MLRISLSTPETLLPRPSRGSSRGVILPRRAADAEIIAGDVMRHVGEPSASPAAYNPTLAARGHVHRPLCRRRRNGQPAVPHGTGLLKHRPVRLEYCID